MTSQLPVTGSFVSTGSPINITIPSGIQLLQLFDYTGAADPDTGQLVKAWWMPQMGSGNGYFETGTDSTNALQPNVSAGNGFTPFAVAGPQGAGAIHTGTAIAKASSIASSATTVGVGSIVRILNPLSMEQISGWDFTVTASTPTTSFTLGYLDASGFEANATTFSFCVVNPDWAWYPRTRLITKITQASQAVITLSVTHNLNVGQLVRIKCPNAFGMSQMAGQVGQITAIDTTNNTITVNINSSGYTAFAFPTSAVAAEGDQWPMVVPIGEFPNTTNSAAFDNQGSMGLTLGTDVCGAASDQMYWVATPGIAIS